VLSKPELKRILSRAEHSTPKVHITLDVVDHGDPWTVEARAKIGSAYATDTEGSGWIARSPSNQPFYAARDLSRFNRQIIDDAYRELATSNTRRTAVTTARTRSTRRR
jgi:hypothetical protein